MRHVYRQLLANILIAILVFDLSLWIHHGNFLYDLKQFGLPALCFYGLHFFLSLANRKYEYDQRYKYSELFRRYNQTWLYSSGLTLLVLVTFQIEWISRQVLLVNIFGLLTGEFVLFTLITILRQSVQVREPEEIKEVGELDFASLYPDTERMVSPEQRKQSLLALRNSPPEVQEFIIKYFDLHKNHTLVLNTNIMAPLLEIPANYCQNILNLHRLNNIRYINKFIESANSRLPYNGYLMVCAETKNQRKMRIMKKYPPLLNSLYYTGDFIVMRVFPKLPFTKKIYFWLTGGNKQVISRAEILGRLISCGFDIVDEQKLGGQIYVVARKVRLPFYNNNETYGLLIYLNRIGKDGKIIKVYKLRTMHPFSEYIQDYVYRQNNLESGGKIKNDFRINTIGKIMRRFWIDELPTLWNWIRGDLKLVGVRPLSRHYFDLYSTELKDKRIRTKPGIIPPFYADMPKTLDEIMASELKYLGLYEKNPMKTDVRYFFHALFNILFKGARSK